MNSGGQRLQFHAIVEDVPHSKRNLRIILEQQNLQDSRFFPAFELKCCF